jgi:hypothetical protein
MKNTYKFSREMKEFKGKRKQLNKKLSKPQAIEQISTCTQAQPERYTEKSEIILQNSPA